MKKILKFRLGGRVFILPPWVKWLSAILAAFIVTAVGVLMRNSRRSRIQTTVLPSPIPVATEVDTATPSPFPKIWVYVVGEVNLPGVYSLDSGALISDAIEAAGGFTEQGDREAVNLVSVLRDNAMIKVPAKGENTGDNWLISEETSSQSEQISSKININTANLEELCTLSGVGESTAKKIISYREANGSFETIEDIMKVPGIKESKFEAIKENICVG